MKNKVTSWGPDSARLRNEGQETQARYTCAASISGIDVLYTARNYHQKVSSEKLLLLRLLRRPDVIGAGSRHVSVNVELKAT